MYAKQYRTSDLQRKPGDLQQFTRCLPDAHAKQYR
jgi:hypothetical protein